MVADNWQMGVLALIGTLVIQGESLEMSLKQAIEALQSAQQALVDDDPGLGFPGTSSYEEGHDARDEGR